MGESVLIYDSMDGATSGMGRRAADEWGWRGIGVDSIGRLETELTSLKKSGVRIDRLMFYTHGNPGSMQIGTSSLSASGLRGFAGKGFEDLFTPGADVAIPGCKVAAVKGGCGTDKECADRNNGPLFLATFAEIFLFKGGGRVHGWDSNARGLPRIGVSYLRWWDGGNHWYAFIKQGGSKSRLAMGRQLSTPMGSWTISGTAVDFGYWFRANGEVLRGRAAVDDGWGKWKMDGDWLRISWDYGGVERWDLPLFEGYQTGIAGHDYPIRARKERDLPSRVA